MTQGPRGATNKMEKILFFEELQPLPKDNQNEEELDNSSES